VFFWGILWRKTHPIAAIIALLGSPLIGLSCDWVYEQFLSKIPAVSDTFGKEFNFLYRVFTITVLASVVVYSVSLYLNKKYPKTVEISDFVIEFGGIWRVLRHFGFIQIPCLALSLSGILLPQTAAFPAAIGTFLLSLYYLKQEKTTLPFYKSDIFYAGLLTSAMVWIMYFFA
jgi:SSS family solute:Na+ symporter